MGKIACSSAAHRHGRSLELFEYTGIIMAGLEGKCKIATLYQNVHHCAYTISYKNVIFLFRYSDDSNG